MYVNNPNNDDGEATEIESNRIEIEFMTCKILFY